MKLIEETEKTDMELEELHMDTENCDEEEMREIDDLPDYADEDDDCDDVDVDEEEEDVDEEEEDDEEKDWDGEWQALMFEESLYFLDDMVGMEHVKQKLQRLGHYAQWRRKLEWGGVDVSVFPQPNLTFMFVGDPGTGKTTVARQMGKILQSIGLLSSSEVHEFHREELVGQCYGCEEENTLEALKKSEGGVFFLDEAYQCFKQSCDPRDPAYHILETLMAHFGKPNRCIIMAGYKSEMEELFKVNPGFRSRIPKENIIEFAGPSEQLLMDVATHSLSKMHLNVIPGAHDLLCQHIHDMWASKDKDFGNARVIRQLTESIVINHANRIMTSTDGDDFTINELDIRQSITQLPTKTLTHSRMGFV